jgi:competence protein ComEC
MLIGLGATRGGYYVPGWWCLLSLLVALWRIKQRTLLSLTLVACVGLCGGLWRGAGYLHQLQRYDGLYGKKTTVIVTASEDAAYGKTRQLSFAAHKITLADGTVLRGKIQVSGFGTNAIYQDDVLVIMGKLQPSRGAYQGRLSFASIRLLKHHPSIVASIRRKFVVGTQNALPEPLAPFVMGLLIGQRATLPDGVKQDLQKVGLTHIIAVSGYNLTIILHASRRFLGKRSKRITTVLSLLLIGVFLLLAGASASIVRAAIVSVLSIVASYYGRGFKPINLLALAAVITAWANPAYVWSDISWYLSFLAFYGVMVLSPLVQKRWPGKWHGTIIGGVALESFCAELITLPFILFIFGQMSRVGLIANVLVVSLVPLAMLLGVVSGLAGMVFGAAAGWLAWPALVLLNYMLDTAHLLAALPHVFVEGIGFPLSVLIMSYVIIIMLTAVLNHKTKGQKAATITDTIEPMHRGILA